MLQGKLECYISQTGMSDFGKFQPLLAIRADDRDRAKLHPSSVWAREGKDHG
jgi:hypothetical protein